MSAPRQLDLTGREVNQVNEFVPPAGVGLELPLPLTQLLGRELEVAAVGVLLRRSEVRLLVLTGPGGVGKTRVALQAAAESCDAFPDGAVFVPLAPISDPGLVLPTLAARCGLRDTGTQPLRDRLTGYLRRRRLLLVLDNFEQVLPAAPELADLLAACSGLTALVTSRSVLRISGERDYPVPPLALPELPSDACHIPSIDDVVRADAVRLFVERAQAVRPDLALTAENAGDVVAICRRLDGLPLAIELAATPVSHLPLPALLARLEQRLPLLTGGPRDQPGRLQTMHDAIAWSYDLLEPEEQVLFRRLAVFIGGFSLGAAEAVANAPGDLETDVLTGVSSLLDGSLLQPVAGPAGEPRFGMLETIREYALERLEESGKAEEIRHAHASHYLAFAAAADDGLLRPEPAHGEWRDRLAVERDNLRAALGWLADQGEAERSQRLAGTLGHFWFLFSDFREGLGWLERTLALPRPTAAAPRALALRWAGLLALYRRDVRRAATHLDESLALYRGLPDTYGTAQALVGVGLLGMFEGDYERALAVHEEALALVRTLDNSLPGPPFLATVRLHNLGAAAYGHGDYASAAQHFEEALARVHDLGYSSLALLPLTGLGNVARDQGDYTKAANLYCEALDHSWARANLRIVAYALAGLGSISGARGQPQQAARLFGAAEALQEAIGVPLLPAYRAAHERTVAAARAAVPAETFADPWSEGGRMPLERAIADARTVAFPAPDAPGTPSPSTAEADLGLTRRQREVLNLLVEGRSDKQIAAALCIARHTASKHVAAILAKLGVPSRSAAVAVAARNRLV